MTTNPEKQQGRTAGAVLVSGGLIFFLAEFIAAAAWTRPPYSYTYHYISNLGVHGPSVGFGQAMYSPLDWVMNTGFALFGITLLIGTVMLAGPRGGRRWTMIVTAFLMATGGVLLAFFHGTGETPDSGAVDFHSIGALLSIVGGNVLVIMLGRTYRQLGIAKSTGTALVLLGAFGLASLVGFLAVAGTTFGLIGLVERCAVYPLLLGFILAGRAVWSGQPDATARRALVSPRQTSRQTVG